MSEMEAGPRGERGGFTWEDRAVTKDPYQYMWRQSVHPRGSCFRHE